MHGRVWGARNVVFSGLRDPPELAGMSLVRQPTKLVASKNLDVQGLQQVLEDIMAKYKSRDLMQIVEDLATRMWILMQSS